MDPAPYTWRARSGYLPAPAPEPAPPAPAPEPVIIPMAQFNYQYYIIPQQQPLAYAAPIFQQPAAPAPAASVVSKKSSSSKKDAPAPPAAPAPAPKNANDPPKMSAGMNYMFPAEYTKLHIFNKASKVWEDKHVGKSFNFKIFNVATTFTPSMVIENVLGGKCEPKGWAITEVVEKGDGAWAKGSTIEHGGDKGKGSLASMGWTGKRGDSLPPVWVVVHKI